MSEDVRHRAKRRVLSLREQGRDDEARESTSWFGRRLPAGDKHAEWTILSKTPIAEAVAPFLEEGTSPFAVTKIVHVVLRCADIARSVGFYTQVMGFKVSDVYEEDMVPGGMVFMRFSADHHGIALVGSGREKSERIELHHLAFAVSSLDELFRARAHLERNDVAIVFEGRRRAGAQIAVEFPDPDGHMLEIYWGLDQIGSDGVPRPASEWRPAKSLEEAVANPVRGQKTIVYDERLFRGARGS